MSIPGPLSRGNEIDNLYLLEHGVVQLGGIELPLEMELPAIRFSGWILSKPAGHGEPLFATRGDGQSLRFQFDGRWTESVCDSPGDPHRRPEGGDDQAFVDGLHWLASLSTAWGHQVKVVDGCSWGIRNPASEYHEGDISLYSNGTVMLGSATFAPGEPIDGYRFGPNFAYRGEGDWVLVVWNPEGVRWFVGRPARMEGRKYDRALHNSGWSLPYTATCETKYEVKHGNSTELKKLDKAFANGPVLFGEDRTFYVQVHQSDIPRIKAENSTRRLVRIWQNNWLKGTESPRRAALLQWASRLSPDARRYLGNFLEFRPGEPACYSGTAEKGQKVQSKMGNGFILITIDEGTFRQTIRLDPDRYVDSRWAPNSSGRETLAYGGWEWSKFSPFNSAMSSPDIEDQPAEQLQES